MGWWIPVGEPVGDGMTFPIRPHCRASNEEDPETFRDEHKPSDAERSECGKDDERKASGSVQNASEEEGTLDEAISNWDAESFLPWLSPEEFCDDLSVGCEFIGNSFSNTFFRAASMCL